MGLQALVCGDDGTVLNTQLKFTNPTLTGATLSGTVPNAPTTYTADGAIPIASGVSVISKTSAAAMTIAAPGAAGIGVRMVLTTGTNFAHVVTFTGATLYDGTTGANSTWTAAAFIGSSLTIYGLDATHWVVESFNLGTIAP